MTDVSIGPARRDERPRILELLEEVGLPPAGPANHLSTTLVARRDGRVDGWVVGSAALELYGPAALLRSVAVRRDLRGTGLGRRLTGTALELSRHLDVEEAYLLTETADLVFPRFGFRPIPRSEVPRSVRSSVEFTSACPRPGARLANRIATKPGRSHARRRRIPRCYHRSHAREPHATA